MSSDQTAVLFFSRTLNDEFGAKSFGLNQRGFSALYKFFVNKTLQTVRSSGLPLIEFYSDRQVGNTFNERLTHSLRVAAEEGFTNVIIIGNDTPELSADDLLNAEKALEQGHDVLGQDAHGGVYLIGLVLGKSKSVDFRAVQWHSRNVYKQLSDQLECVFELSAKNDLNTLSDFKALLRFPTTFSRGLRFYLKRILFQKYRFEGLFIWVKIFATDTPIVRGPPSFVY